jgi:hypothetical protein
MPLAALLAAVVLLGLAGLIRNERRVRARAMAPHPSVLRSPDPAASGDGRLQPPA